ncbi:MAG: L-2-amino-thiazoline-4-carboxylic acid hydrolase [Actinobacteria bacterium]|nr:L-2-amino-thiazoline-4-carboxylic acid hydrolase [Actinomycetota bacterium]
MNKSFEEIERFRKENKNLKDELEGLKETVAVYLGSLIRELVQAFGDKGRELVKEAARKGGLWQGQKYIKEKNIQKRGTKAAAELFQSMSDVGLFEVKTEVISDKKFTITTNVCPYIKIWKEMGLAQDVPDFCILATYYDLGLCQAFNPDLKINLPVDMLRGCDHCVYEFIED